MFPEKIPGSDVVKSTSRASLAGKYITATIVSLFPVLAYYFFSVMVICALKILPEKTYLLIGIAAGLAAVSILFPLILGVVRYFWRLTDGLDEDPSVAFYYFESFANYKRALKSAVLLIFKFLTSFIPCMLPYFVTVLLSNGWLYRFLGTEIPLWVAGLALLSAFLKYAGLFLGFILFLRHYLFVAVVVMDDDLLIYEASHISTMVSAHSIGSFAALIISLMGWILLSLLIAPMVYTAPLILSCFVIHCRYAIVNYNQALEFYSKEQL